MLCRVAHISLNLRRLNLQPHVGQRRSLQRFAEDIVLLPQSGHLLRVKNVPQNIILFPLSTNPASHILRAINMFFLFFSRHLTSGSSRAIISISEAHPFCYHKLAKIAVFAGFFMFSCLYYNTFSSLCQVFFENNSNILPFSA